MYKHSSSFVNSNTSSSGFQISIPNDNLTPSTNLQVWVLYIDVPVLKSVSGNSGGSISKPPYISDWYWKYDQSFMLILPYVPENFNMKG